MALIIPMTALGCYCLVLGQYREAEDSRGSESEDSASMDKEVGGGGEQIVREKYQNNSQPPAKAANPYYP